LPFPLFAFLPAFPRPALKLRETSPVWRVSEIGLVRSRMLPHVFNKIDGFVPHLFFFVVSAIPSLGAGGSGQPAAMADGPTQPDPEAEHTCHIEWTQNP